MYALGHFYPNYASGAGASNGYQSAVLGDGGTVVAIGNTDDLYSRLVGLGLINGASLVNSCNGGKADALYNFVPSPVQSLDRFVVTRASTKLRIGSNGLYGSVANNVPAFEFNTDGTYRGLLVEPGATNLALRSTDWSVAPWSSLVLGTGVTPIVTANAGTAPDGTTTATRIQLNSGGALLADRSIRLQGAIAISTSTTYTASIFVRANGAGEVGKTIRFAFETNVGVVAFTVVTLTDSWQRVSVSGSSATGTTGTILVECRGTITGQTADFFAHYAQLETGSVATSPIVTTGSTAARVADSVTLASASGLIGQSAGTIYVEAERVGYTPSVVERIFNVSDGSASDNRIGIYVQSGTGAARVLISASAVAQADIIGATLLSGSFKLACAYASNDVALYRNGSSVGTDASATIPACSRANIGTTETGTGGSTNFNGWIRSVALFPTRLANATLASLTTL